MPNFHRSRVPVGTYFFTVTLNNRDDDWLVRHIDSLRDSVRSVRQSRPFGIDAWVVLPEHIHAVWTLPHYDADYSGRWREIKKRFSKVVRAMEGSRKVPDAGELWQPRFWEHTIMNEQDYRNHLDYVHYNPVKHGWVKAVKDWPYSTFHKAVEAGLYPREWGGEGEIDIRTGERDE